MTSFPENEYINFFDKPECLLLTFFDIFLFLLVKRPLKKIKKPCWSGPSVDSFPMEKKVIHALEYSLKCHFYTEKKLCNPWGLFERVFRRKLPTAGRLLQQHLIHDRMMFPQIYLSFFFIYNSIINWKKMWKGPLKKTRAFKELTTNFGALGTC